MKITPQLKTFLLGLSISVLVLAIFFAGAVADRIFVIKPLDVIMGRRGVSSSLVRSSLSGGQDASLLGKLVTQGAVDVADVAEVTSESVVTISVKREQRVIDSFDQLFGLNPFSPFEGVPETRVEQIQEDIGTGFVAEGNLIVTNKHVVSDGNAEYLVIDKNDVEYEVTDVYRDPSIDMAILKVEGVEDLPSLPLGDSEAIRVGEGVIAIGTALGEFRHTVTTGVISGLRRGIEATDGVGVESLEGVIQTDAAINPGNSGGPLLDMAGNVIGVNVAVSAAAENIGFAIPINVVKSSIDSFNQTGQFERPFLGVRYRMVSEQSALFNEVPQGAYVLEVVEDSTASDAGLQEGDIISHFGSNALTEDGESLASIINSSKIGETVTIEFWRDGQKQSVTVELRGQ